MFKVSSSAQYHVSNVRDMTVLSSCCSPCDTEQLFVLKTNKRDAFTTLIIPEMDAVVSRQRFKTH